MALLGLDIGSYAAKAILLETAGGKNTLLGLGLGGLSFDGALAWEKFNQDANEKMALSLKALLKNSGLPQVPVATALSSNLTVIEKISIPHTQAENPESYALKILAGRLPYHPNELYRDCEILNTRPHDGLLEAIFVAAPKKQVDQHLAAICAANLKMRHLDVEALALANAYEATFAGERENVLLLDIGAYKMTMVFLEKGVFKQTFFEPFGGQEITEALSRIFRVGLVSAEAIKVGSEIVPPPGDPSQAVIPVVNKWLEAIKWSLAIVQKETPSFTLDKILLSGGQSLQEGLAAYVASELNVPTSLFNPLIGLDFDERQFDVDYLAYVGPQMLISFGLALR